MEQTRITPDRITSLKDNEIFVFGSNKEGMHGGGAARIAYEDFGAEWGVGIGMTGQCYAIPTMDRSIDIIHRHVDDFTAYAKSHPALTFLVTPIGCGIAGWRVEEIAPLFNAAAELANVALPESFWKVLKMSDMDTIISRHSVRRYLDRPLPVNVLNSLRAEIANVNAEGNLHVQLVTDEPQAFSGVMAYGKFSGVKTYLVMAGRKSDDLDERIGYYGERLVLLAQRLGLNSCWAGISYRKVSGTYSLEADEKICCYIAIGYGETPGVQHKSKSVNDVSNASPQTPDWFRKGVEYALLAPTAVNQQKFFIEFLGGEPLPQVRITRGVSLIGYTRMDMGIVKLHFELAAGPRNFRWAK